MNVVDTYVTIVTWRGGMYALDVTPKSLVMDIMLKSLATENYGAILQPERW